MEHEVNYLSYHDLSVSFGWKTKNHSNESFRYFSILVKGQILLRIHQA